MSFVYQINRAWPVRHKVGFRLAPMPLGSFLTEAVVGPLRVANFMIKTNKATR